MIQQHCVDIWLAISQGRPTGTAMDEECGGSHAWAKHIEKAIRKAWAPYTANIQRDTPSSGEFVNPKHTRRRGNSMSPRRPKKGR